MIFDIYEQADLFRISGCGRKASLENWLDTNHIPYSYNVKGQVIAHQNAVAAGLGCTNVLQTQHTPQYEVMLGD